MQRQGVQIFIATHDYLILKQLDLQTTEEDRVAYHALYRDETGELVCNSTGSYLGINPNAIADAFADVYDLEVYRRSRDERTMTLSEGNLRLTLPERVAGRQFDDGTTTWPVALHESGGLDLEFPEHVWFIEVKDPDAPGAKAHHNRNEFLQEFMSGKLSGDLATKFRDSFIYEWACNRVGKPISYYVIVASADLDDALLLARTEDLRRKLPVGTPAIWGRAMVRDALVFNVTKWNEVFPEFPLSRTQQ